MQTKREHSVHVRLSDEGDAGEGRGMTQDAAGQAVHTCVLRCAQARDWRGRWRQQENTQTRLQAAGTSPTIAAMTALAAAELGAWIRQRSDEIAREIAR